MKFFVVALLLALTASTSAGVYKIIEESKDRVINEPNDDALSLGDVNETNKESRNQFTNGHIAGASASIGGNEILEQSNDRMSNSYKADALPLDGVDETRNVGLDSIANGNNADAFASNGVNETLRESEGRITNGYNAYQGQFPYQVGLRHGYSWCGGSLIGSQWVLTAAHCTSGVQSITVYLGDTRRTYGHTYTVSRNNIIIHHAYNAYYLKNDISLIKIPAVSLSNSYIQTVKLPAISNYYSSYVGETVIASGWGLTSDSTSYVTNNLQWARLRVMPNNVCAATYGSLVSSTSICVYTSGGTSTCNGDSGGPMVLESSKILIGLTSFGIRGGCQRGYPAGFTRITSYLDWIKYYTGIYYT